MRTPLDCHPFLPQIMLKFWRSGCGAHDLSSTKKLAPQISSVPVSSLDEGWQAQVHYFCYL